MFSFWGQSLTALFHKIGLTAWPILLCSIFGTAIIVERAYYFSRLKLNYARFVEMLFTLLRTKKIKEALLFSREHRSPIVRIAFVYLKHVNHDLRGSILSREGSLAMEKVESRLRGLAAITHIAPLLGLLGTVTGLVTAFHTIESLGGQVRPEHLAGGIWEALLSTVFGLLVAIPCMSAYHGFYSRADQIAKRMQTMVSELDEFFNQENTRILYHNLLASHDELLGGVK